MNTLQQQMFELGRRNLAVVVDMITAPLEGLARLQTQQLTLMTQVLTGHARFAASLDHARSPEDLKGVYETLMQEQIAGLSTYCNGVQQAAMETEKSLRQRRVWGVPLQQLVMPALEPDADEDAVPPGDVVRSTVTAISARLSQVARVAAESARLVAEQAAGHAAGQATEQAAEPHANGGADGSKSEARRQRQRSNPA